MEPLLLCLLFALFALGIGVALCITRMVRGPTAFDRAVAFDCAAMHLLGGLLIISILEQSPMFLDVVLIVGLLGFLGTIALAFFLEDSTID